jgi:hypothetical protein
MLYKNDFDTKLLIKILYNYAIYVIIKYKKSVKKLKITNICLYLYSYLTYIYNQIFLL